MIFTPLEQFQIYPLICLGGAIVDFSITNVLIASFVGLVFPLFFFFSSIVFHPKYFPSRGQMILESIYKVISGVVSDSVGVQGQRFFPFFFFIFFFVLISNLSGLVPYSFTLTSHIAQTFVFGLTVFFAAIFIGVSKHGYSIISLFLPGGTSMVLAFLLVPLELISYIFKPISLAVRLFANMMAGHTLLKVIAGFSWGMLNKGGLLVIVHIAPLFILILLFGLELGVAIIQAYVFTILSCIYINDAIVLH